LAVVLWLLSSKANDTLLNARAPKAYKGKSGVEIRRLPSFSPAVEVAESKVNPLPAATEAPERQG
jgi:hypothetical protein